MCFILNICHIFIVLYKIEIIWKRRRWNGRLSMLNYCVITAIIILVAWLPSTKNSRKRRLVLAMAACVTMGFQQKSHTKINSALSGKGC